MSAERCASCECVEGVERHHLYLRAEGCPDDLTVPLCNACHGKAHGMKRRINISDATKAALAEARERGVKLGGAREGACPIYLHAKKGNAASVAFRQGKAAKRAEELAPIIAGLRAAGASSLQNLADGLNRAAVPAPRGGKWSAVQVMRVIQRTGEAS